VKIFAMEQVTHDLPRLGLDDRGWRKWGRFARHQWMDGPREAESRGYWARHHFLQALWRVADQAPDAVAQADLVRGPLAQRRFEALIEKMTDPASRNRLTNLAAKAVENAESVVPAWNKAHPDRQVPARGRSASARFRDLVRAEAEQAAVVSLPTFSEYPSAKTPRLEWPKNLWLVE